MPAPNWGGVVTSKDQHLKMAGETPISPLISLFGHTVTSPSPNLSDAVTRRIVRLIRGQVSDFEEVIRPAQLLSLTLTMGFGPEFESALEQKIIQSPGCNPTLYSFRLCPDPKQNAVWIWEKCIFSPPQRVNDVITIEDTVLQDRQSEFRIVREIVVKEVGAFLQKPAEGTPVPLYAVAFFTENCKRCTTGLYANAIAVGGDGTNEIEVLITDDRFSSSAAPGGTVPAPIGSIGTCVWTDGDLVLVGFSDEPKINYGAGSAEPTTGGVMFSVDGGENFSLDTNITVSIMGVGIFNNRYVAVGGADGGAAFFARSDDGITWTSETTPSSVATDPFTALAVDDDNGKVYLVTAGGKCFVAQEVGNGINFGELTLPGSPTALYTVSVLDDDRIAVAGKTASSNYYAESFDGGATWVQPTVPGTALIQALGGGAHHNLVANAGVIRTRSALTEFQYKALTLELGASITGNISGLCFAPDGYPTHALVVTDDGEVISVRDYSPYWQ